MTINPVLVIFTSHRIDCLKLCLNCLEKHTNLSIFKSIYIIANSVPLPHLLLAKDFCKKHPNAHVISCSPRGLVPAVMKAFNDIIEHHKNDVILKIDEDVFVTNNWIESLYKCYITHKERDDILLSASLCPISLSVYNTYIENVMRNYHEELFLKYKNAKMNFDANKYLHRYVWDSIINHDMENNFSNHYSEDYLYVDNITINCIIFDSKLISEVYPFPIEIDAATGFGCVDELSINRALHGRRVAIPKYPFVHHYSHWRSEDYMRKHIPVSDVRSFLLGNVSGSIHMSS
ncbi:MAG: hypothetical protein HY795_15865 [Desulfovibrio sp.]|nr:hypothetical protein [Desulfovibrio sp.]MBI4958702.1 hypothetical protein [Desulfovibrio sp.]